MKTSLVVNCLRVSFELFHALRLDVANGSEVLLVLLLLHLLRLTSLAQLIRKQLNGSLGHLLSLTLPFVS